MKYSVRRDSEICRVQTNGALGGPSIGERGGSPSTQTGHRPKSKFAVALVVVALGIGSGQYVNAQDAPYDAALELEQAVLGQDGTLSIDQFPGLDGDEEPIVYVEFDESFDARAEALLSVDIDAPEAPESASDEGVKKRVYALEERVQIRASAIESNRRIEEDAPPLAIDVFAPPRPDEESLDAFVERESAPALAESEEVQK